MNFFTKKLYLFAYLITICLVLVSCSSDEDKLEKYEEQLKKSDIEAQQEAIEKILILPQDLAIEGLESAIKYCDESVQINAAQELSNFDDDAVISSLKSFVDDDNSQVRLIIAKRLSESDNIKAIKPLTKLLDDPLDAISNTAYQALLTFQKSDEMDRALVNSISDESSVRTVELIHEIILQRYADNLTSAQSILKYMFNPTTYNFSLMFPIIVDMAKQDGETIEAIVLTILSTDENASDTASNAFYRLKQQENVDYIKPAFNYIVANGKLKEEAA